MDSLCASVICWSVMGITLPGSDSKGTSFKLLLCPELPMVGRHSFRSIYAIDIFNNLTILELTSVCPVLVFLLHGVSAPWAKFSCETWIRVGSFAPLLWAQLWESLVDLWLSTLDFNHGHFSPVTLCLPHPCFLVFFWRLSSSLIPITALSSRFPFFF